MLLGAGAIKIIFTDRKLERACSEERECRRRWGGNCRIVQRRLAALLAAETLADMSGVPGRCHALRGNRAGQYAVHLWEPYRLVFEPADVLFARAPDGALELTQITEIRILEIVDYHGD